MGLEGEGKGEGWEGRSRVRGKDTEREWERGFVEKRERLRGIEGMREKSGHFYSRKVSFSLLHEKSFSGVTKKFSVEISVLVANLFLF